MRPMKVTAGESAPDVEELIEKASSMDEMLAKVATLTDDSQMRNITGVEEARMSHYWTNQTQVEEGIESVANTGAHSETISFDNTANPHQTGSTLSAHENNAGGATVKKGNMGQKDKYCQKNFGCKYSECSPKQKAQCDKAHGGVKKAPPMPPGMGGDMGGGPDMGGGGPDDLAALLGGAGGAGGEDMPDDPMELAKKIEQMGKKIQDMLGGGMGDMGAPPPGGDDMGGEGGPMPMAPGM